MNTMESTFPVKIEAIKTEYPEAESTPCLEKQEGIKLDYETASTSFCVKKEQIGTESCEAASFLVKKEESPTDFSDVASTSYLVKDVEMKTEEDEVVSTSSPRKRELKEEKTCVSEDKKAKTEPAEVASTSRCVDPNDTPIGKVTNSADKVNVSGKVIYCTLVHDWRGGRKMYFDLSDETGIIRVIAWNGFAATAAALVQLDKTIQLKNAEVRPKHSIYNNLDHPCELALNSNNWSLSMRELRNCPIRATALETRFIPFGEARRKQANKSFDVSGTIKEFYSGYGGEEHNLQVIKLKDEKDVELEINVWNKYIEISQDMIGKKMDVIRCTYDSARDRVDSMGAHINIDGRRVEKYHLASAKFKSSGIGAPLDFFLALAGFGYYSDDNDGWGEDYDGSYDDYDGSFNVDSEDSDEDGDEGSVDNSDDVSDEENSAGLENSVL